MFNPTKAAVDYSQGCRRVWQRPGRGWAAPPEHSMRACEAGAEENAAEPETFDLQLGAEEMAILRLTDTLGNFQARKTTK